MSSFQDGKTFRVSLHKAVLDAVVDHFQKMAGPRWTDVCPSFVCRRRKCFENGTEKINCCGVAADHEAVAFTIAPNAAAGSDIDVANTFLSQGSGSLNTVLVIRVAAIDDNIVRVQQASKFVQGFVDDLSRRQHDPHYPRRL